MSKKSKQRLYDAAVQEFNKALDKEAKAWVKAHVQAFREIEAEDGRKEALTIEEPVLVVCISNTFEPGMSAARLYECTRGIWKVNPIRAANAKYVFAAYHGTIVEVFEVLECSTWDRAGTTPYRWRTFTAKQRAGRYEFVGKPASASMRNKYVGERLPDRMRGPYLFYNC